MFEGANLLVGGFAAPAPSETTQETEEGSMPAGASEDGRGTEFVVALLVLGALLLLVLFNVAGFRAVIGVRASVGG